MQKQPNPRDYALVLDIFLWILILLLLFGALGALNFQIEALVFPYPLDYGEAPLINQAMQLNAGQAIYRQSLEEPPYTIANYPPVYVGLLAIFEKVFGPAFWYGRLISSLSAIGSAAAVFLIVNSRSKNWKIALIPALLLFNIPYVVGWSTLARIDHLALFFALIGLYLLFRKQKAERLLDKDLLLASGFLVLAVYTRQSYALAAPFAGFIYLLQKDWKRAAALTVLVGGMSLALFLLINGLTGGGFFFNIVTANINPFGFERVVHHFRNFFDSAPYLFILAVVGMSLIFKHVPGWPLVIGFVVSGFFSAVTIGKIGSNVNYFLEFAAGLSLLVGFGLWVLFQHSRKPWIILVSCACLVIIGWQNIAFIQKIQDDTRGSLDTRQEAFEALQRLEELVSQNSEEPILADEYMGMIILNDDQLYLQPFEVTQLALAGVFDQQILINQIEAAQFSLILLQEDSWWIYALQERWTPEMLATIRANYRLVGQFESTFAYKPKNARRFTAPLACESGHWPLPTNGYLGYRYDDFGLTLYGAGTEGQVPVKTVASGEVFRPEGFPEGALAVVYEDPLNPEERVILYYADMRSSRSGEALIPDRFPTGTSGLAVDAGETIGYQSMWSDEGFQQDWLHVTLSLAPYNPQYLADHELLQKNLINPGTYFGIRIDTESRDIKPISCMD